MERASPTNRKWHPSEIEMVRHLITNQDFSFQQVADRFHISKNAIIGVCNRNAIKHSDTYVQINKPVTKPICRHYGDIITKHCLFCQRPFKTRKSLERKYCETAHATAYHNRAKQMDVDLVPRMKRKEFLEPPEQARKCPCGSFAVPKYKTCYQQKRECYDIQPVG